MNNKLLTISGIFLGICLIASSANAEETFWTFTDDQVPVPIPAECDAHFDEVRGGVFVPTPEEVFQNGMNFLQSDIESVKRQSSYCLLMAAFAGNNQAQLELARMYNEGKYLPQDDLSAYKWSFIAALDGNKNAERFALTLEQFLSNEDLTQTSAAILETRTIIEGTKKARQLAEQEAEKEQAEKDEADKPAGMVAPKALEPIFGEEDRMK